MILRTRLMASSSAFLSSTRLELLTLTTSRCLEGVGVIGRIFERGGGVAALVLAEEPEGDSVAAAGLIRSAAFFPRLMFDTVPMGRRGKTRSE